MVLCTQSDGCIYGRSNVVPLIQVLCHLGERFEKKIGMSLIQFVFGQYFFAKDALGGLLPFFQLFLSMNGFKFGDSANEVCKDSNIW